MQNSEKRKEGMTPCSANFGNNEHCAGSVNVVDGKGTLDQPTVVASSCSRQCA